MECRILYPVTDIRKSYDVVLKTAYYQKFSQYIQADSIEEAGKLARETVAYSVASRYVHFNDGFTAQKACDKTILSGSRLFGHGGKQVEIDCTGMNIFQAMELAEQLLKEEKQ